MTIGEWLDRLNLYHYVPMFTKNQLYLITELKYHQEGDQLKKENFKFKEPLEEMRIKQILNKDFGGQEDFKYMTENSARRMLNKYIKNEDILEELISYIEPDSITGFQLKDIIIKNYSPDDLTDAIKERVELTKQRAIASEDPRVVLDETGYQEFKEETDKEKAKRYGQPTNSVEKLFEECNCKEAFKKMVDEHDINDYLFWTMDEEELFKLLEIQPWGANNRLKMRRS